MPQFGEMLRELREERRLTQIDLANIMHISSSAISSYETGAALPPVERAMEFANFLEYHWIICSEGQVSDTIFQFCIRQYITIRL